MSIFGWIGFGLLVGWMAGLVLRGGHGTLVNVVLGLLGALSGGILSGVLLGINATDFHMVSVAIAAAGAILLIVAARLISHLGRSI